MKNFQITEKIHRLKKKMKKISNAESIGCNEVNGSQQKFRRKIREKIKQKHK